MFNIKMNTVFVYCQLVRRNDCWCYFVKKRWRYVLRPNHLIVYLAVKKSGF